MSSAGTVTTRPIRPCTRSSAPGRANATTSARCGRASTSYQLGSSPAASAPRSNANRFPGSRPARARRVRTVYDGVASSSSIRSTRNRGFPATASASISARCSGDAAWAACLNGCSRAGRNRTVTPRTSASVSATTRWPTCTGSNEPPNSASTLGRAGGAGGVACVGGAAGSEPVGLGIILPQVGAGFLELLDVADGAVAVHQSQQRVGDEPGARIVGDDVLEVDDRGVVRATPEIEHAVLVVLLRKPLVELADVQLRAGRGARSRVAPLELLIRRQRRLPGLGVELGPAPQAQVGVARA